MASSKRGLGEVDEDVLRLGVEVERGHPERALTVDELKAALASDEVPTLWDARALAEWDGTDIHGNARPGHVPGARNLEWRRLMQGPPARRFRPLDEIRADLEAAGIDVGADTVTYCQAGIRGAFAHFVLAMLGNERVRTYDGSMGEWANRQDTPLVLPHAGTI